jgi:hypothetical protein
MLVMLAESMPGLPIGRLRNTGTTLWAWWEIVSAIASDALLFVFCLGIGILSVDLLVDYEYLVVDEYLK